MTAGPEGAGRRRLEVHLVGGAVSREPEELRARAEARVAAVGEDAVAFARDGLVGRERYLPVMALELLTAAEEMAAANELRSQRSRARRAEGQRLLETFRELFGPEEAQS